jgi:hypothetical protein
MKGKMGISGVVLVAIFAAAISSAVVTLFGPRPPAPAAEGTSAEIARLRMEIDQLKGMMASQRVLIASAPTRPTGAGKEETGRRPPQAGSADQQDQAGPPPDPTPKEVVRHVDSQFFAEPGDTPWGRWATAQAATALPAVLPPGSSLGKIECRETLCRIEARHADLASFQKFSRALVRGEAKGLWNAPMTSLVIAQSADALQAITFVAREGRSVPAPEPLTQ